jgi:mRNA-degrading endonuclease RelE of RelBE toxin-antitoxin system
MYQILYSDEVVNEDLPDISLKGYRKLKVGDYRIVLRIEGEVVKVFVIQHRSVVYVTAPKRL